MAHYFDDVLKRPATFNFATDVVDYWATQNPGLAMHWLSQDHKQERKLTFDHFRKQSHRLAILLRERMGVKQGDKLLLIMPRVPEWYTANRLIKAEYVG